jgi:hypothetical protein
MKQKKGADAWAHAMRPNENIYWKFKRKENDMTDEQFTQLICEIRTLQKSLEKFRGKLNTFIDLIYLATVLGILAVVYQIVVLFGIL